MDTTFDLNRILFICLVGLFFAAAAVAFKETIEKDMDRQREEYEKKQKEKAKREQEKDEDFSINP